MIYDRTVYTKILKSVISNISSVFRNKKKDIDTGKIR